MFLKAKTIKGYKLHARDGEIGTVNEFYFDDNHWTIRYLIADTGNWLMGRQVLISPYALGDVNTKERFINIDLTKKQIEDSPSLETDQPISRQFEESFYGFYGWPVYWAGSSMWGAFPIIVRQQTKPITSNLGGKKWDANLRSTHDVSGHHIQAKDGEIGHADDFIIDDENWAIRYIVVDTRNWLPGKKVLISPRWIERISWPEARVFVNLTQEKIKQSPEYLEDSSMTRDYENRIHGHYSRKGYWIDEPIAQKQTAGKK